jgi:beta-galactosidase
VGFVQFDNELTGIHLWHSGPDYNATTMGFGREEGRFPKFLRARYGDIRSLNRLYSTDSASFAAVRPVPLSDGTRIEDIRRAKDYLEFYLGTVAEYAATLAGMMREHGIDTPFVHNSGSPGMDPLFLETVRKIGGNFVLGSDHYYNIDQNWPQNNPTPQYALGCFCSLEMLRLMGQPPSVFELPGGSPADWPPFTPEDARCCYWTNLAFGMKGSNFYLFTGGPNPPGTCLTSDVYDFAAAIGADGEVRPLYGVQKELGLFLQSRPWLARARRESDCRFALDFDHPRADYYWKSKADPFSGGAAWEFFRKGVLTTALCASTSPVFCDLGSDEWTRDFDTPVVVVSSSSMARDKQERIVRFLKAGGRALLAAVIPSLDERFLPCSVLATFLGNPAIEPTQDPGLQLKVGKALNIQKSGIVYTTSKLPAGAEPLGWDQNSGRPVSWGLRTEGGGQFLFLGVRWNHAMHQHVEMLTGLLQTLGIDPRVRCSNPNIWTSLLSDGDRSMLFAMNLFTAPMEAELLCRPASRKAMVSLGRHKLAPLSVQWFEI